MPQQDYLDCIEIESADNARVSIIWLHGLGASKHDFAPMARQLPLPQTLAVRYIFPQAPRQAVTINGGIHMPAWFDIRTLGSTADEDAAGIQRSQRQLEALIEREIERGISSDKIFLAGFSQGGAMVLHTGVRYQAPLAGIIALSCYLPLGARLEAERHEANHKIPILMAHGSRDAVVLPEWADLSAAMLVKQGYPLTSQTYPIEHTVSNEEVLAISDWIQLVLSSAGVRV